MVAIRRQWVKRVELPLGSVSTLQYGSDFSAVNMYFSYQTVQYLVKLPIALRVRYQSSGVVAFYAYSYAAYSLLTTWSRVLRHLLWGGLLPYSVLLEVRGLGYRVTARSPQILEFAMGLSHLIFFTLPGQITAKAAGNKARAVQLTCPEWLLLTQTVSVIKKLKKVNLYKERGIFYRGEVCRGLKVSRRKKA